MHPATALLHIYPKELKAQTGKDTCVPMFTAALLTIAKRWKQLKHPSTEEWISKMWHILKWNMIQSHTQKRIVNTCYYNVDKP